MESILTIFGQAGYGVPLQNPKIKTSHIKIKQL